MPRVVHHMMRLFADDSKLIGIIKNHKDIEILQDDLNALVKWANDWRMLFHPDKCKVMEITKSKKTKNPRVHLSMERTNSHDRHILAETFAEKDLGVQLTNNLKSDVQAKYAAAKASRILGQLNRTFKYWTVENFKVIYCAYVRPHLEYAAPVWSPHLKKDIKVLERVQRRATKLVPKLRNLSYQSRLTKLNLTTLEDRRTRGDLIQFFKINSGFNIISWQNALVSTDTIIQTGPSAAIRRSLHNIRRPEITKCEQREFFFTHRTIPLWNALPSYITAANSINEFKNKLDRHLSEQRKTKNEALRLGAIIY